MNTVVKLKPVYISSLEEKIERYRVLDRELTTQKSKVAKIKEEILNEMGAKVEAVNSFGHVIAKLITSKPRETFDKTKFNLENPGIYENYLKIGKSSVSLKLT